MSLNRAPTVIELDFKKLQFSLSYTVQGKQRVDVNFEDKSRLRFQLPTDFLDPYECKYRLDRVNDEQDGNRRGQALNIMESDVEDSLKRLDEAVIQAAIKNSKDWFKKELTEDTIRDRYRSILQRKNPDDRYGFVKFKIKTGTSQVLTILHKISTSNGHENDYILIPSGGNITDLETSRCKMSPILSTFGLYIAGGGSSFGLTMQADELAYMATDNGETPLSKFTTKRSYGLVTPDEDSQGSKIPRLYDENVKEGTDQRAQCEGPPYAAQEECSKWGSSAQEMEP